MNCSPRIIPALTLGALGAGLAATACGAEKETLPRFNVVLVSLDSTRQDLLSAYGRKPLHAKGTKTSPNLDSLAAQGVLFRDAYATTSWTLPSHHSLLTGQPELVHGVDLDAHRLDTGIPTLAELLQRAGYRTAGFFSGPYLEAHFGFDRGFERYEACYGPGLTGAWERMRQAAAGVSRAEYQNPEGVRSSLEDNALAQRGLEMASHRDVSSDYVTDAALAELRYASEDDRPFFLFVHYFDPHYDYIPPEPYDRRFDRDYKGPVDGDDFYRNPAVSELDPNSPTGRRRVMGDRDLEHIQALYEGELAWVDAQIGELLERLKELKLDKTTLVVVVADHGDEFFEHGSIGHRRTLFEEVVRVPLIMRLPEVLPAGDRVTGPVSLIDVVPTVLEILSLRAPQSLASESLLPTLPRRTSTRGVFGRIVRTDGLRIHAQEVPVEGQLVTVVETYRKGPVKITRERRWTIATQEVQPEVAEVIERQSAEMRAEELLRWIDLERHPDERAEDHSTEFSDERALAALAEFHDRYAELLDRRRIGKRGEDMEDVLAALAGLGYVGQDARIGALPGEELELPPPGERVLRDLR